MNQSISSHAIFADDILGNWRPLASSRKGSHLVIVAVLWWVVVNTSLPHQRLKESQEVKVPLQQGDC